MNKLKDCLEYKKTNMYHVILSIFLIVWTLTGSIDWCISFCFFLSVMNGFTIDFKALLDKKPL